MDKLEQLYNLYLSKGIITDKTSFKQFSDADDKQRASLYELGRKNNLFKETDLGKFSTAWESQTVKKKESSEPTSNSADTGLATSPQTQVDGSLESPASQIPTIQLTDEEAGRTPQRTAPTGLRLPREEDFALAQAQGIAAPQSDVERRITPKITEQKIGIEEAIKLPEKERTTLQEKGLAPPNSEIRKYKENVLEKPFEPKEKKPHKELLSELFIKDISNLEGKKSRTEEQGVVLDKISTPIREADVEREVQQQKDFEADINIYHPYKYYSQHTESDIDNSFTNEHFGNEYLKSIGIDPVDFDGYLNEKGFRSQFERNLEDGIVSDTGETKKTSRTLLALLGLPTPLIPENDTRLSYEMEKFNMLMGYVDEIKDRDRRRGDIYSKQETEKPIKINVFNDDAVKNYIETELPLFNQVVKDVQKKNQEIYQKHLDGETGFWYGAGKFVTGAGKGFYDRVQDMTITATGFVSPTLAKEGRFGKLQQELKTPNQRAYSFASGKEVEHDGKTYLVNDDGNIYDTQLKINVTDMFMNPKPVYDKAEKSTIHRNSFSTLGLAIESGNVMGDLAVQILTTRGFSLAAGATTRSGVMLSSMGAQTAMGFSRGLEDTWRYAKQAGLTDDQAKELAHTIAPQTAVWYGATALISPQLKAQEAIFGGTREIALKKAINRYANEGIRGVQIELNKIGKEVGRRALIVAEEGLVKEGVQEFTQQSGEQSFINPQINRAIGDDVLPTEWTKDNLKTVFAISTIAGGMPAQLNFSSSSVDRLSAIQTFIGENKPIQNITTPLVTDGVLTPEQAQEIHNDVEAYKKFSERIPKNLSQETVLSMVDAFRRIESLENEKSKLEPAFHAEFDQQISQLKTSVENLITFSKLGDKRIIELKDQASRELINEAIEANPEANVQLTNGEITQRAIEISLRDAQEATQAQNQKAQPQTKVQEEGNEVAPETTQSTVSEATQSFANELDGVQEDVSQFVQGATKVTIGNTEVILSEKGDNIAIESIRTPRAERGQGSARAAINQVVEVADRQGKTLQLNVAAAETGVEADQLVAFYESVGFVKEANFDSDGGLMTRQPQSNIVPQDAQGTFLEQTIGKQYEYADPVSGETLIGEIFFDGNEVVFTDGKSEHSLGTVQDAVSNEAINATEVTPAFEMNESGELVYNGNEFAQGTVRLQQSGLKSIKRDKDGNIKRIVVVDSEGNTRNVRGKEAIDLANVILLDLALKTEGGLETKINTDETARQTFEQAVDRQVQETAEAQTDRSPERSVQGRDGDGVAETATEAPQADPNTRRIRVPDVRNAEFDVTFDNDGNVTEIKSLDGRVIPQFTERTLKDGRKKAVLNGNYSSIEAAALGETTLNQVNQQQKQRTNDAVNNFTPSNEREHALAAIAKGAKINLENAKNETGLSANEVRWAANNKSETTVENLAEQIAESSEQALDESVLRDEIIDILSKSGNLQGVQNEVLKIYESNIESSQTQEISSEEWNAFTANLTEQEMAFIDANVAEDAYLSELTDNEIQQYYEEQYQKPESGLEQLQQIDTQPESSGPSVQESQRQVDLAKNLKLDELIDGLDNFDNYLTNFGKENLSVGLPIAVMQTAVKAMKVAAKTTKVAADILSAGINAIQNTNWYKNLNPKDKQIYTADNLASLVVQAVRDSNREAGKAQTLKQQFKEQLAEFKSQFAEFREFQENQRNELIQKLRDFKNKNLIGLKDFNAILTALSKPMTRANYRDAMDRIDNVINEGSRKKVFGDALKRFKNLINIKNIEILNNKRKAKNVTFLGETYLNTIKKVTKGIINSYENFNTLSQRQLTKLTDKAIELQQESVELNRKLAAGEITQDVFNKRNAVIQGKIANNNLRMDALNEKRNEFYTRLEALRAEAMEKQSSTDTNILEQSEVMLEAINDVSRLIDIGNIDGLNEIINRIEENLDADKNELKQKVAAEAARLKEINELGEKQTKTEDSDLDQVEFNNKQVEKSRKITAKIAKGFTDLVKPLTRLVTSSYSYMIRVIDVNSNEIDGVLFKRFYLGKDGIQEAGLQEREGVKAITERVQEKYREIFGVTKLQGFFLAKRSHLNEAKDSGVVIINKQGKAIELSISRDIGMTLYAWSQNAEARDKLLAMGFTNESFTALEKFIGSEGKQLVDWTLSELMPELQTRYNETHLEVFRTTLGNIDNFFPLFYDNSTINEKVDTEAFTLNMGNIASRHIKQRIKNSKPLSTSTSFSATLLGYIAEMEKFRSHARFIKDSNALLSSTEFKRNLDRTEDGRFERFKRSYMLAIGQTKNDSKETSEVMKLILKGEKIISLALLFFNFTSAFKQIASAIAVAAEVPSYRTKSGIYIPLVAGAEGMVRTMLNLNAVSLAKNHKFFMKENRLYKDRINSGQFGEEAVKFISSGVSGTSNMFGEKSIKKPAAAVIGVALQPTRVMDAVAVNSGGKAVYDMTYNAYRRSGATEAASRIAANQALDVYIGTQQSNLNEDLSGLQQKDNPWSVVGRFKNAQIIYFRRAVGSITNLTQRYGRLKEKFKGNGHRAFREMMNDPESANDLSRLAIYGVAMNALFAWMTMGLPGLFRNMDDEDEEDLLLHAAAGTVDGIPIVGDVAKQVPYYVSQKRKGKQSKFDLAPRPAFVSVMEKDFAEIINLTSTYDAVSAEVAKKALMISLKYRLSVDVDVFTKTYDGVRDMAKRDMLTKENVALFFGAPKSLTTKYKEESEQSIQDYYTRLIEGDISKREMERMNDYFQRTKDELKIDASKFIKQNKDLINIDNPKDFQTLIDKTKEHLIENYNEEDANTFVRFAETERLKVLGGVVRKELNKFKDNEKKADFLIQKFGAINVDNLEIYRELYKSKVISKNLVQLLEQKTELYKLVRD